MQITYTVRPDRLAALRETIRRHHPNPSESAVESTIVETIDEALDRMVQETRISFIPLPEVMIRLANMGQLEAILSLAQTNELLGSYWEKVKAAGGIWSGSPDSLAGTAALVAYSILTQEQADALLYYPVPELPA
jgi:hypothetical protein